MQVREALKEFVFLVTFPKLVDPPPTVPQKGDIFVDFKFF